MSEKIDRKEFDEFSAHVLINFALINAAAIAAVLSSAGGYSTTPYAWGLFSATMSLTLWFFDSAFDYLFGEAQDKVNIRIGTSIAFATIFFGVNSAGAILFGCLTLLKLSHCVSFLVSAITCGGLFLLLLYASYREDKLRSK